MPVNLPKSCVTIKQDACAPSSDDQELISSLIAKNESRRAFTILFERYYTALYKKALKLLKCHFSAEEVVADVFLKVWSNRETLQTCERLRSYLYTAIHNRCVDYLRRQQSEKYYAPEHFPEPTSAYLSPEQRLVNKELDHKLQNAIGKLPPMGRTIFCLSREEGMKYLEIAEALGISVKTVETHMRRSLRNLRHQF